MDSLTNKFMQAWLIMTKTPPSKTVARLRQSLFGCFGNDRETLTRLLIAFRLHPSPLCPGILASCLFRDFFVHKIVVNIYIISILSMVLYLPSSIWICSFFLGYFQILIYFWSWKILCMCYAWISYIRLLAPRETPPTTPPRDQNAECARQHGCWVLLSPE